MASDAATGRLKRDNNGQAVDATGLAYDKIQASKNQPSTIITDLTIGESVEAIRTKRVPLTCTNTGGWVIPESARRAAFLAGFNAAWSQAFDQGVLAERELAAAERAEAKDAGS